MAICSLFFAVLPQHLCAEFSSIPLTCCSIMRAFRSRAFRFLVFHGRKKKKKRHVSLSLQMAEAFLPWKWLWPDATHKGRGRADAPSRQGGCVTGLGPSKTPQPLALPVRACHSLALAKPPSARVSVSILCDGKWLYRTGGSGDCWCPRPLCCCRCW